MAILVRTSTTLFEIPNQSLGPEITRDYHERTRMMSLRYFFGWMSGTVMTILMWFIFLKPTEEYPNAQLNPEGYQTYGIVQPQLLDDEDDFYWENDSRQRCMHFEQRITTKKRRAQF